MKLNFFKRKKAKGAPLSESSPYTERFALACRSTLEWVIWKRFALWGACIILAALLCCVNYFSTLRTSRVTLYLNYAQATEGLNPNETRFNIYELKSPDVMEQALAYAGLSGQYTPQELSDCLSIRATNATSVSGSSNFISTSYKITFKDKLHLRGRSSNTMLSLICKAYKDFFISHYADNQSILQFTGDSFASDEYLMQLDMVRIKARQLQRYVSSRLKENKNFTDSATGESFSSLQQRINNFLNYDLNNSSSYILESGISHNKSSLLSILDYKIRMNTLSYDRFHASYEVDNEGIALYDKAMSSIVMIPTIDTDSRYYMSRTKTGMDDLATHADGQLIGATETLSLIEYDRYVSDKMRQNVPSAAQREKADQMLRSMQDYLRELSQTIQQVDNAYVRYSTREYLEFKSNDPSFIERAAPVSALIDTLFLMIGFLLLRLLLAWIKPSRKKGAKRSR